MEKHAFAQLSIDEFLRRLGSDAPTPGGGSVAALTGAMAAALGRMVTVFTVGKPKFANVEPQVRSLAERLTRAEEVLRRLMDEDAAAYEALRAALQLDASDPQRARCLERAAAVAGYVPLETATACGAVLTDLDQLRSLGNPMLRSDAEAAVHLARAAVLAAAANVRVNLALMREGDAGEVERQLDAVVSKACGD